MKTFNSCTCFSFHRFSVWSVLDTGLVVLASVLDTGLVILASVLNLASRLDIFTKLNNVLVRENLAMLGCRHGGNLLCGKGLLNLRISLKNQNLT